MVVDMSGSMAGLATEVRGAFNHYVDSLVPDLTPDVQVRLTVTLFDNEYIPLAVAAPLKAAPRLDVHNYKPRGMTALLDAIGDTISRFEDGTTLGPDDRVLLVVQTDGRENASQRWQYGQVREMLRAREATGRWTCIYLGSGPDAWNQGSGLGFNHTLNTTADPHGTRAAYDGLRAATTTYSAGGTVGQTVSAFTVPGVVVGADSGPVDDPGGTAA